MELIQILIILFALFAFSRVVLRFKDGAITFREFVFWSIAWIAIIFVTVIPSTVAFASNIVGGGRTMDFVVYVSIIVLFYLMFRLYVKIESVEHAITNLTREIAVKRAGR